MISCCLPGKNKNTLFVKNGKYLALLKIELKMRLLEFKKRNIEKLFKSKNVMHQSKKSHNFFTFSYLIELKNKNASRN